MYIRFTNVQPQKGIDNCGALAITMACDLCRHLDPFQCAYDYDQAKLRLDNEQVFIHSSFHGINFSEPRSSNRKSGRVLKALDVKLHCVCHLPDLQDSRNGDMACCDACKHWYHSGCVEIPAQVFVDPTVQWFCANCV